jgi:dTDP-glucose 4,6-dehydratase
MRFKRLLVTGGAGFIGSAFIRFGISQIEKIVNLDLLTYAGNPKNVGDLEGDHRYRFVQGDICDERLVETLCLEEGIEAIVHFAAESHVDRSIQDPTPFFHSNVLGTLRLLEVVRRHPQIHFHHISTDEVYGSLAREGSFHEESPYRPNSPYAASKAASDHLVRAYGKTYGLSTTLSHCCNNYGPYQFPEKLIPCVILNCMHKRLLPIYGRGENMRDWLHVDDHAEAIWMILERGVKGEVYAIGARCEIDNLSLVKLLIQEISRQTGEIDETYNSLITFVTDRAGHDFRYAIDPSKIMREIGWRPRHSLQEGLSETITWYFNSKFGRLRSL